MTKLDDYRWELHNGNKVSYTFRNGSVTLASIASHRPNEWVAYTPDGSMVFIGTAALERAKQFVENKYRK